jgi:peptidoglycan/xylan/chitin deacetylase (PgdA/CDA1 family)
MVALTFDDGPTPFTSPPIISFLEQTHTPATFFVMGQYARAYPWLVQREAADGFAIGVHTWNHPDMQLLSVSARAYQLGATIQQLHDDLGPNFCAWLWRPPYGSVNSGIVEQADAFGLTTINWDVDPQDWSRPGTMVIVQRVLAQVRPGSIILMHDGPAARQQTAAALPYILAGLQARGLVPVTIPTLLGSESAPTGPVVTPTPLPTATATATPSPTVTATATATDTPTPTSAPTDTPTSTTGATSFGGPLAATSGGAIPIALSRWLWQNTIAGYAGA